MLTRFHKLRDEREAGFTLIELLIVVAIIGILAAIAIPVFLNQRDKAANSGAESETKNAATALEVFYTENSKYPALSVINATGGPTITVSQNVALKYTPAADLKSYTLMGCNVDTDVTYTWDSTKGAFNAATGTDATFCVPGNAGKIS